MGESDDAYRKSFSDIQIIRDMFDGIVQQSCDYSLDLPDVNDLDWPKAALLNTDFAGMECQQYKPDSVWRIPYCHGKEPEFLLLMKHQPTVDPGMALWMLTSVALLYQDLLRLGQVPPGAYYPQVMPVVVYSGLAPWSSAKRLKNRIHGCPQMRHLQPDISYILLDQQGLRKRARLAFKRVIIHAASGLIPLPVSDGDPQGTGLRL